MVYFTQALNEVLLKFLANENIPFSSVSYLKSKDLDVTSIGVDYPGIADKEVMELAISENRTIVTYDSDYGELIFKYGYKPEPGVIFIRFQPADSLEAARIIESLIEKNLLFNRLLTVVDKNSIRQKKY